jgi:biopolymer transport protein ExbB
MWALVVKGGPIMVPIIALSVVALAIVLERLWALAKIRLNLPQFAQEILLLAQRGQYQKALLRCHEVKHPLARVLALGLTGRNRPREELERMMEREGEEQIERLERNMGALIVIIGVEPMLGFLGTIIGLIKAFMSWEQLGANVTVNSLAAGIYQAMITTAAGLIVAIPYFICYHLFLGRIKRHALEMSYYGNELLDVMSGSRVEGKA